jgi:hypothetical protein
VEISVRIICRAGEGRANIASLVASRDHGPQRGVVTSQWRRYIESLMKNHRAMVGEATRRAPQRRRRETPSAHCSATPGTQ